MLVNSQNTTQSKDGLRNKKKKTVERKTKYQRILVNSQNTAQRKDTFRNKETGKSSRKATLETLHKAKADLEIEKLVKLKEDISAFRQAPKVQHKAKMDL